MYFDEYKNEVFEDACACIDEYVNYCIDENDLAGLQSDCFLEDVREQIGCSTADPKYYITAVCIDNVSPALFDEEFIDEFECLGFAEKWGDFLKNPVWLDCAIRDVAFSIMSSDIESVYDSKNPLQKYLDDGVDIEDLIA